MARILVVEDDPSTRKLVALHLQSDAHEVVVAEDGMQGLHQAVTSIPAMIIADWQMPVLNGISLLAAIRANAQTAAIPVIFLTSSEDPALRARAQAMGVSDFLTKPFLRSQLLDAVSRQVRLLEANAAGSRGEAGAQADVDTVEIPHGFTHQTDFEEIEAAAGAAAELDTDADSGMEAGSDMETMEISAEFMRRPEMAEMYAMASATPRRDPGGFSTRTEFVSQSDMETVELPAGYADMESALGGTVDFEVSPRERAGGRGALQAALAPSAMETMELLPALLPPMPSPEAASEDTSIRNVDGSVVVFAIHDFARVADRLPEDVQVLLISAMYENVRGVVAGNGGWTVKSADGAVIGMFEGDDALGSAHAERALKAALLAVLGMQRFRPLMAQKTGRRELARLAATAGVHSGRVSLCRLAGNRNGGEADLTIIGDTVNVAARLQSRAGDLGWSVVASEAARQLAGARFDSGRYAQIGVKGRDAALEIVEITRLLPRGGGDAQGDSVYAAVAEAIAANTRLIDREPAVLAGAAPQRTSGIPTDRQAKLVIQEPFLR